MSEYILGLIFVLLSFILFSQEKHQKIKISSDLELIKLSDHVYIHVSFGELSGYDRFASNGVIYIRNGKAFLFDSPINDSLTKILITWLIDSLQVQPIGFIPNHSHDDCMGGISYLHSIGVESFANHLTTEITRAKNLETPMHSFKDSITLNFENSLIKCYFFGTGHSSDNIVIWLPSEKILFPGCMVKELSSKGLGNTADANIELWNKTIDSIITHFPTAKIIIPGHGLFGDIEILNHTKLLLKNSSK